MPRLLALLSLLGALWFAHRPVIGDGGDASAPESVSPAAHAPAQQPNSDEWPVYGGDAGATRYASLADINRSNVATLAAAWTWRPNERALPEYGTQPGTFQNTPLMIDDVLYDDLPGDVRAFDARTGEVVWTFRPIPRPGEFGNETWANGSWAFTGHTNVWAPMSLDLTRGLVYLPVSTPSNDYYGATRPGANLFAESIVCLDARSGQRRWHFQIVHHG